MKGNAFLSKKTQESRKEYSQEAVFCNVSPLCVRVSPKNWLYIYGDDLLGDPLEAVYIILRYFSFYLDRICVLQQLRFHKNLCVLYSPFSLPHQISLDEGL